MKREPGGQCKGSQARPILPVPLRNPDEQNLFYYPPPHGQSVTVADSVQFQPPIRKIFSVWWSQESLVIEAAVITPIEGGFCEIKLAFFCIDVPPLALAFIVPRLVDRYRYAGTGTSHCLRK